jgi:hypothetical protein
MFSGREKRIPHDERRYMEFPQHIHRESLARYCPARQQEHRGASANSLRVVPPFFFLFLFRSSCGLILPWKT